MFLKCPPWICIYWVLGGYEKHSWGVSFVYSISESVTCSILQLVCEVVHDKALRPQLKDIRLPFQKITIFPGKGTLSIYTENCAWVICSKCQSCKVTSIWRFWNQLWEEKWFQCTYTIISIVLPVYKVCYSTSVLLDPSGAFQIKTQRMGLVDLRNFLIGWSKYRLGGCLKFIAFWDCLSSASCHWCFWNCKQFITDLGRPQLS